MTNNDAAHLILRHRTVHYKREAQQNPGKIWSLEDKQSQEAEQCVWVLPTPYVDEGATKSRPEESHGEHGSYAEKERGSECEQPREVGGGASGRFFEKARVALEEEDVIEEVETERSEVEESCDQSPVLLQHELSHVL